jgi:phosphoglucosamine mutase
MRKRKYFGTDGVRGRFGDQWINPEFARRLGRAAGQVLAEQGRSSHRPLAVIGRDTRESGPVLEAALVDGLRASGVDVIRLGVAPTAAVALAVLHYGAGLGVVVTASHNPADDNGIKFFSAEGRKLTDQAEEDIERWLDDPRINEGAARTGEVRDEPDLAFYEERLIGILPPGALQGWTIVMDAANGAGFRTGPRVLRALGARVIALGDLPDGRNINEGVGSQHPEILAARVRSEGADLGLALDGDGDRIVAVDETGEVVPGDALLALLALHALEGGKLAHRTLVVTVQSNLGLDAVLRAAGGKVERTDVGDRNVLARLVEGGFNLGGESSGHISFPEIAPAGDGLLAALKIIEVLLNSAGSSRLSQLASRFVAFPQQSEALRVEGKPDLASLPRLSAAMARAEAELGDRGRILVRYSGTEPKIRLLVEGSDRAEVRRWMQALRQAVAEDGLL